MSISKPRRVARRLFPSTNAWDFILIPGDKVSGSYGPKSDGKSLLVSRIDSVRKREKKEVLRLVLPRLWGGTKEVEDERHDMWLAVLALPLRAPLDQPMGGGVWKVYDECGTTAVTPLPTVVLTFSLPFPMISSVTHRRSLLIFSTYNLVAGASWAEEGEGVEEAGKEG